MLPAQIIVSYKKFSKTFSLIHSVIDRKIAKKLLLTYLYNLIESWCFVIVKNIGCQVIAMACDEVEKYSTYQSNFIKYI
jgi:hypothetical protein